MTLYIAAPYELRAEANEIANTLTVRGHVITSRWLLDSFNGMDGAHACMDLADVASADTLLLLNPPDWAHIGTGGRHVELGYALALGKQVVVLGVRSNVENRRQEASLMLKVNKMLGLYFLYRCGTFARLPRL